MDETMNNELFKDPKHRKTFFTDIMCLLGLHQKMRILVFENPLDLYDGDPLVCYFCNKSLDPNNWRYKDAFYEILKESKIPFGDCDKDYE